MYEGDFVNNKKTGKGVWTWPSGKRYEGDFASWEWSFDFAFWAKVRRRLF
jgi:hypothetical protein